MEENKEIFLADGDVLVYLAEPMHKKYSTKFVWGHWFSKYVSDDRFIQSHTLLIDGLFLNQKTNNNIRISYSLKYKHLKKKFFKSHTRPKILHLISDTLSHINGIVLVHLKSYLTQCF